MAMPTLRTDFAAAVSHLATSLQMNAALLPDVRNISTTTSSGRGGGRGSNNRGRGRGRGKGRGNGGRNIYLGNYNAAQWRALSVEDKKKVREGRKRSAEQQSHTPTTINVSHVTTANQDPDAQSTVTTPTAVITRADTENAGSAMTHRQLNAITTGIRGQGPTGARSVAQVRQQETQNTVFGTCELDSHADTCVAGPNSRILEDTGFTVSVTGFSDKLHGTVTNVPIVKAATAYDDPLTGTTYILVLGQAIYMGDSVEATLLCPNQLRYQGIVVDDCPKHLAPPGNPSTHSLFIPENQLRICFKMKGPVSVFDTRMPTKDEISTCRWVTLNGDEVWDPHSESFQAEEEKVTYHDDYFLGRNHDSRTIMSLSKNLNNISDIFDDYLFINRYVSQVATGIKKPKVSKEQLAQRWGIGLSAAENTIKVTTQMGIRNLTGHIDRRLKTKQAHSRYPYLSGRHGRFYTDTFFASVPTIRSCTCAQLYTNDIGFIKVYPMQSKAEAYDSLNTFIHEIGIPHELHSDNAKELMEDRFKQICCDYGIKTTYSEPHSPWQNRAEAGIRELKRHVHRKMKARNVPLRLWDFCCKWTCAIRACTASNSFALEGRSPWEVVMGNTPDISSLSEFNFYEPVWYYEPGDFPEPK